MGTDYHLEPHPLNSSVAEAFDLTFTGVQGATVHCQLIRPKRLQKSLPSCFNFMGITQMLGIGQTRSLWLLKAFG